MVRITQEFILDPSVVERAKFSKNIVGEFIENLLDEVSRHITTSPVNPKAQRYTCKTSSMLSIAVKSYD